MKRKIKWILIIAIAAVISFQLGKIALYHFDVSTVGPFSQHGQAIGHPNLHKGGFGQFSEPNRHMMHGHSGFMNERREGMFFGNFLSILLPLVMIMVGWILYKLGKQSRTKKIIGAILAFLGLWALLPKWIVFLGLLAAGYYFFKTRKAPDFSTAGYSEFVNMPSQKLDFLDEWERKNK